ncbi:MAG: chromosome segregation protein SMC, partial [Clostridiales bacterium]|nr:chromosome segregation protein SMC [Clostridiales bacterium]
MYFKKIYMHGFKSFAEPVTIEFNDGITCIVGPNGSGKSNISDALRWVLGEQSPKALRGGKMDEVIFAGTASRKSRGMAEVTLTIDNSTGILPIDYNEVAITRRMYRSGQSEYLINNNQCRLRDIRELIMDTGIGVDGYSIIGQGKIADIVSNKPESRREIFEEAAGIVMYRTKKEDVEKKLASSNANLERVNDIVSEIEGRIGNLKEDSEKATQYLELRDRYRDLEVNITLKNIENIELKMEYLKDDIAEANVQIEGFKEEKLEIDKASSESRVRSEALETLTNESQAKLIAVIDEINTLVNRSEVNRERIIAIDDNRSRLSLEIEALSERLEKEREGAEGLIADKEKIDDELKRLDEILKEQVSKYEEMTKVLGDEAASIDEQRSSIYELHSKAQTKRAEAGSLENLKATLAERKAALIAEKEEAHTARADAERVRSEEAGKQKELASGFEKKKEEVRNLTSKYNDSLLEEKTFAKNLEDLRISIGQLTGRKKTMEEMEASYEGYNHAVRYIMKSGLAGIDGVVAELMSVPSGYETAIETALGAALQNIVCADDMSAKKAISLLKENRAGRLTFLPIASIKGSVNKDSKVTSAKGFIGYGCDCIEFDAKYRNVFEYLLGRTVVVKNMDDAIALSKTSGNGLRFVTLEGEVIMSSGAITGGKHKNTTGNLLERKAEITKLEAEITEKTKERDSVIEKLSDIRKFIETAQSDISKLGDEAKNIEMDLIMCQNRLEIAESVLADLEAADAKNESELSRIEEESAKSEALIRALREEADEAEKTIEETTELASAAMEVYEQKKEVVSEINEEIIRARMAVTACEEQKNSADSLVARVNTQIADFENQIAEKTAESGNLLAQRNEI